MANTTTPKSIKINIDDFAKLKRMADRSPALAQKYVDQAIVESIGQIARATYPITPRKEGYLRNSMVPIFRPFRGVLGSDMPYARKVHDLYPAGTPYKNPSKNKSARAGFLQVGVTQSEAGINHAFSTALAKLTAELANTK